MKKLILIILLLLIGSTVSLAAHTKQFNFLETMIVAMDNLEEGRETLVKANDMEDRAGYAREVSKVQSAWKFAQRIIRPYVNDTDEKIRETASTLDQGLDAFIRSADYYVSLSERAKRGQIPDEEETITALKEGEAREDEAYQRMGSAIASFIPDKLTKSERGFLAFKIDLAFSKPFKVYRFHPNEVTKIVIAMAAFEGRLLGKKVGENPFYQPLFSK